MANAGKWRLSFDGPYPLWGRLTYDDGGVDREISSFTHKDLRDLEYTVQKGMREARERLGEHDAEQV